MNWKEKLEAYLRDSCGDPLSKEIVSNLHFNDEDADMLMYVVDEAGRLIAYDYDGLNRRELASGVSSKWPIIITNDKWLYYFGDKGLVREWLIPHNV